MSLTLADRIRLVEEASAEHTQRMLEEADAFLVQTIDLIATDYPEFQIRKAWIENQPHKPVVSRGLLRIVGLSLMVAAVVLTVVLWR